MSDIGTTINTDPGASSTSAPSAPPAAPPGPSGGQPASDVFADLANDQHVFDRGYVERLRSEGARYRTEQRAAAEALAPYEQAFGPYDADDRAVWFDLARTWAQDAPSAARAMLQIAQAVLGEEGAAGGASPEPTPRDANDGSPEDGLDELTPAKVQEMIASALGERERAINEQRAVDEVYAEIRAAGFDPATKEGFMVLWLANNQGNGDIAAAVNEMKAWKQSIVDDYVASRSNGHHPAPSPANGAVATTQPVVHDFDGARRAAQAFIDSQIGASSG